MRKSVVTSAALLVALCASGSLAVAVDDVVPASTTSLLNTLYAGSTLVRVHDTDDGIWISEAGNATATARYAGYNNTFGYVAGVSGSSFTTAFAVPGGNSNFGPGDYTAALPVGGSLFRMGLSYDSGTGLWTSLDSDNADGGVNHMVTYYISSGIGVGNYVIAWDDQPSNASDRDFNDLIITIAGARPTPEPGTLLLFGSAAAGLFAWTRRSRKAAVQA